MTTPHDDFELKRALDALPRSIEPPEDLWPGVRGRLAPRVRRAWWTSRSLRVAAGLAIVVVLGVVLARQRVAGGRWRVAELSQGIHVVREFAAGDSLATDQAGRALFEVGTIGHVEVSPGTRVRLVEARATAHRLALARGTIHARISAPPRLFVVETPSGTAVDLGCAYTLEVDSTGASALHVTLGWVAFEADGREALVPAGFRMSSRTGGRLGTPYRDDAPAALRQALAAWDTEPGGPARAALAQIVQTARRQDAITLWHLLARTEGAERARVYERLASLVPPPRAVTRENVLALDAVALRLWWQQLPGSLEIVPRWTRSLWTLWLRLFG